MKIERKPEWLKIKIKSTDHYSEVKKIVETNQLHTICSSGMCPNKCDCWNRGTATFMILGDICTRSCKFCATKTGNPLPIDHAEAEKVAESIQLMQLKHCVITSVDRDELVDKGAGHWANTVRAIREKNPSVIIELLIPDYELELLKVVNDAQPDIIGHNMETVKRLTPQVRSKASYERSMQVLRDIVSLGAIAKTGIMVGLGETEEEVYELLDETVKTGTKIVTIGQYLRPTAKNWPVAEYVHPDVFERYKEYALKIGFSHVESAPLVRSSYMAENAKVAELVRGK